MKHDLPLPEDKKLCVTYRVEPGCLGPEGAKHVVGFCEYAQKNIQSLDADYISWTITPRNDKSLPEMQYNVVGKRMNHAQAEKYLAVFDKSLDEFEGHLEDKLAEFIGTFMGH
ncbi:MAG: hypothetical protein K6L81_09660 [Agarilytica sp.]